MGLEHWAGGRGQLQPFVQTLVLGAAETTEKTHQGLLSGLQVSRGGAWESEGRIAGHVVRERCQQEKLASHPLPTSWVGATVGTRPGWCLRPLTFPGWRFLQQLRL